MIERVSISEAKPIISLASDVVYLQKPYWCNSTVYQLRMSFLHPRSYYEYDPQAEPRPCILFFCGGSFQKEDRLVWIPQLTAFAEQGYVVATADYSTFASTLFPEQLQEAKAAVRFLRANADMLHIDPNRIYAMGESAGGQLAVWLSVTNGSREFDTSDNAEVSSDVQGCVGLYPVTNVNAFPTPDSIRVNMSNFPDSCALVSKQTSPMLLLHGTGDRQVPFSQSVHLHDTLLRHGIRCELLLLEGAQHSDPSFYTAPVKTRILDFLNSLSSIR